MKEEVIQKEENIVGYQVYRKLLYFFENNLPVHFKCFDGVWYNGIILDLSETKLTLVLKEFMNGDTPFLLEHINPEKIVGYIKKGETNERL